MKLTATVANETLLRTLREVQPIMRKDMKTLVRAGSRLALRKAIELTPPMSSSRGPTKETQKFAEKLVASDTRRVFASVDYAYDTIKTPAAASAFWFLIKRGGKQGRAAGREAAEKILQEHSYNVRLRMAPIVESPDTKLHDQARVRGRVPRNQTVQQIIYKTADLNRHIKAKQRNIGFLAAGWLEAATELKVNGVPAWIKRHRGKAPSAIRFEEKGDLFICHMSNKVSYSQAAQLARIIPIALNAAAGGMRAQAKAVALKAAKRAGFRTTAITATLV
jgi:hypothetical protein